MNCDITHTTDFSRVFLSPWQQVLQHVRLPLLSPKFLVGTVGSDPLIKSDEECRWVWSCCNSMLICCSPTVNSRGQRLRTRVFV